MTIIKMDASRRIDRLRNSRLSRRSFPLKAPELENDDGDFDAAVSVLLKKHLHLYRVSQLINLNYDNCSFYSRSLKYSLRNANVNVDIEANISTNADLKLNENDTTSLYISVKSSKTAKTTLYEGWMISIGSKVNQNSYLWLPVLLCRGPLSMQREVHSFLQAEFSCHIQKAEYSEVDMLWMAAAWCGTNKPKSKGTLIKFCYILPRRLGDGIDVSAKEEDIKDIWKACKSIQDTDVFSSSWKDKFIKTMYEAVLDSVGIIMDRFQLVKMAVPGLKCASTGAVQLTDSEAALNFLTHVTELHQNCFIVEDMEVEDDIE